MTVQVGAAAIVWTDPEVGPATQALLLAVPLQEVRPALVERRTVADSLDYTVRDVRAYGAGATELVGRVRYADHPNMVSAMLRAGWRGLVLWHVADLANPEAATPALLTAPEPATVLEREATGPGFVEFSVLLRLRVTVGAFGGVSVEALLYDGTFFYDGTQFYQGIVGA